MNMKTPDYSPKCDFIDPSNNTLKEEQIIPVFNEITVLIPLQNQLSQCHFGFCVLMKLKDPVVMDCHKVMDLQQVRKYTSIMIWLLLY